MEHDNCAVALHRTYELALGGCGDSTLHCAFAKADAHGKNACERNIALGLFNTHGRSVACHIGSLAGIVGHELVGLLGVAGLSAELLYNRGAVPRHIVAVYVCHGHCHQIALLVVLKHGRHLALLGLKRPLHKAAAFSCIANACARSADLVGEHRVTGSLGVCLEVGSRRVVAHISAEVARKLVESLLGGIDGIIDGCNFVIGNRSLAAVNLVDIGNSLSLHRVGENECTANCSVCKSSLNLVRYSDTFEGSPYAVLTLNGGAVANIGHGLASVDKLDDAVKVGSVNSLQHRYIDAVDAFRSRDKLGNGIGVVVLSHYCGLSHTVFVEECAQAAVADTRAGNIDVVYHKAGIVGHALCSFAFVKSEHGCLNGLLSLHTVGLRRFDGNVDVVHLAGFLVEGIVLLLRFPESFHIGVGKLDIVVSNTSGVFHHVLDVVCHGVVVVEAFCVELVVSVEAGNEAHELLVEHG